MLDFEALKDFEYEYLLRMLEHAFDRQSDLIRDMLASMKENAPKGTSVSKKDTKQ